MGKGVRGPLSARTKVTPLFIFDSRRTHGAHSGPACISPHIIPTAGPSCDFSRMHGLDQSARLGSTPGPAVGTMAGHWSRSARMRTITALAATVAAGMAAAVGGLAVVRALVPFEYLKESN